MNTATRGIRNAFRNSIRTFSIVVILGLSIGLALSMLVARQAVEAKIQNVKSTVGNTITISPAGFRGFQGGGEPLTTDILKPVATLPHVTNTLYTLSDRLTSTDSNLVSAIQPGTLGNRAGGNSGVDFAGPSDGNQTRSSRSSTNITRTFTPPVIITGVNDVSQASVFGGSSVSFTSGKIFDATKDENVAVVGKDLATKNNLSVGSTFTAYGTNVSVIGIFDASNTFANASLLMPLLTVQKLSSQTGVVTNVIITVDSIDNVSNVTKSATDILGSKADVVNNQETAKQVVAPLENVKQISVFSLIGALAASATIILLTMVMIVRERRREIGVMKAIGSSNVRIMVQFVVEAMTLTIFSLIVGLGISVVAATPITNALVTNSQSTSQSATGLGGGGGRGFRGAARAFGGNSITNIRNIRTSVGLVTLGEGLLAAIGIAAVGSALPALLISKIRPAEVMRAE